MEEKTFMEELIDALIHGFYTIVYVLFIVPFDLYAKAIHRLSAQRQEDHLSIAAINSSWPYFSFLKRVYLDFIFDFLTMISWGIAIIVALVGFFVIAFSDSGSFRDATLFLLAALAAGYYSPVGYAISRDTLQIMILPLMKFFSWARKPAQHIDLTMDKEVVK